MRVLFSFSAESGVAEVFTASAKYPRLTKVPFAIRVQDITPMDSGVHFQR